MIKLGNTVKLTKLVNSWFFLIKNYLLFLSFFVIKIIIFFIKRDKFLTKKENIVFFNNGQIGDLIISSIILENEELLPQNNKYFFLIRDEYKFVFASYTGNINIITYNLKKYRISLIYKIKILNQLIKLNIFKLYNLSAGRGMLTEEIALLSGAENKYCLNDKSEYFDSIITKFFNNRYNKVFFSTQTNEYEKTLNLISCLSNEKKNLIKFNNYKLFSVSKNNKKYIVISPTASKLSKTWGLENYLKLVEALSIDYKVFIIGGKDEINKTNTIFLNKKNVYNLIGITSLKQTAKIMQNCRLFIGNDSGITHLAIKLGIPFLAIIGGGVYDRFYPKSQNIYQSFLANQLDCFNCQWICKYKEKYCLSLISVQKVLKAAANILSVN
ncbi:MAG: glycosyltransferase family 9 protein [bacterium]